MNSEKWPAFLAAFRSGQIPDAAVHSEAAKDPLFRVWLYDAIKRGAQRRGEPA